MLQCRLCRSTPKERIGLLAELHVGRTDRPRADAAIQHDGARDGRNTRCVRIAHMDGAAFVNNGISANEMWCHRANKQQAWSALVGL